MNVRPQLEGNTKKSLHGIELGNNLLYMTPKAQETKVKSLQI